jgi:hypothetical protein
LLIQIILALSILFSSQDIDEELPTPGSPSSGSHHSDSEKDPFNFDDSDSDHHDNSMYKHIYVCRSQRMIKGRIKKIGTHQSTLHMKYSKFQEPNSNKYWMLPWCVISQVILS